MRILQVNKFYSPWIGGIETVAEDVARHFNGLDNVNLVNLVCQPSGGRKVDVVDGVTTYRAASWTVIWGMPVSLDFFLLFRRLARDVDLIILHHPFPLAFVAYWLFAKKRKLIVWYHSDIVKQTWSKIPFIPFIRFALTNATHIIVSNSAISKSSRVLRNVSDRCTVVHFGTDTKKFALSPAVRLQADSLRSTYGTPLILSVGRLVYYKGYQYLIEAMNDLPSARLLIIGQGSMQATLLGEIERLSLGNRVSIIDPVDNLVPYFHACDVFALPSCEPAEAFGIVQIEAMACGKPVVNTDLPTGVPEISLHKQTGRTVPPKSATALADAIREILSDRQEYSRLSQNAIHEVTKRFSREFFFSEVEKLILS